MGVKGTYRSLVEKSVSSMISAIELYNKPDFNYREEAFAILAVNSWELFLKAEVLRLSGYKLSSIYSHSKRRNKDGSKSKRKYVDFNRSGNPKTIAIQRALDLLSSDGHLPNGVKKNIELLMELRDNAIHLLNESNLANQIRELGYACVKNYIDLSKEWGIDLNIDKYNLYLMPLAYIDGSKAVWSSITNEEQKFLTFYASQVSEASNDSYNVAISVNIELHKSTDSIGAVKVSSSKQGIPVVLSDEQREKMYPWSYRDVVENCKRRYSNFKQNQFFNKAMKEVKHSTALHFERRLDPNSSKTLKKDFYSKNVWSVLDCYYVKKNRQNVDEVDI